MILFGVNLTGCKLPRNFDTWTPDQQETFCKEVSKGLHEWRFKEPESKDGEMVQKIRDQLEWLTRE